MKSVKSLSKLSVLGASGLVLSSVLIQSASVLAIASSSPVQPPQSQEGPAPIATSVAPQPPKEEEYTEMPVANLPSTKVPKTIAPKTKPKSVPKTIEPQVKPVVEDAIEEGAIHAETAIVPETIEEVTNEQAKEIVEDEVKRVKDEVTTPNDSEVVSSSEQREVVSSDEWVDDIHYPFALADNSSYEDFSFDESESYVSGSEYETYVSRDESLNEVSSIDELLPKKKETSVPEPKESPIFQVWEESLFEVVPQDIPAIVDAGIGALKIVTTEEGVGTTLDAIKLLDVKHVSLPAVGTQEISPQLALLGASSVGFGGFIGFKLYRKGYDLHDDE